MMNLTTLKNALRITIDSELRSIRNVIRTYDVTSIARDALVNECDSIFRNRLATHSSAFKMSFWKDHFDWKSLDEYPEIAGMILDFGCGSGHPDIYLARSGHFVHGIDMSPLGIRIANYLREREPDAVKERLSFSVTDVTKEVPERLFDSIWSSNVFEHIVDPAPVLKGLRSWLKPSGFLLISVPYGDAYDDPGHVNHFYNDDHIRTFLANNVHIVRINTSLRDAIIRVLCRFK